ncbi:DNA (cytosine-5)-methyltransferase 1 [Saccharopolyspora kobensis]|uniref:DNA (Cytosine-5)-methyltransferase 1 n=2 Tax=Saccharopolyspora kobensis TaxID=146035 RepID=A0A1H6ENL2_9PSEU|nr:DNA (cytosine-5)-methyltransferase 1 [Saccharopolyspora kobensis]SFD23866.1 DNA (cytosine-5)-methyltransferase 1 [Saccharopolyspora kobensis]
MGLPVGHVSEVPGLSINQQLKLCGNGVVPQQAELAIRLLLPTLSL